MTSIVVRPYYYKIRSIQNSWPPPKPPIVNFNHMRYSSVASKLFCLMLTQSLLIVHAYRALRGNTLARFSPRSSASTRKLSQNALQLLETPDVLMTGLNGAQDVSVKVVSCKNIVDHIMQKNKLSTVPAKYLGEVIACSLMMGAGLKGEESLQINLVGTHGMKNLMAITDGELNIRGMVGNPQFTLLDSGNTDPSMDELLGPGQIQIVRTHPTWKHPMNGITELRNTSVSMNLALYMGESEQRPTAIITDVQIANGRCVSALGIMVETLPGAVEENIETSITNLGLVQKKGLLSYLVDTSDATADQSMGFIPTMTTVSGGTLNAAEQSRAAEILASLDTPIDKILDDCLVGMDAGSIRWNKTPKFKCSCGVKKVYRALNLLPKSEIQSMVDSGEDVQVRVCYLLSFDS